MADSEPAAKDSTKEEKAAASREGAGIPKAEFVVGLLRIAGCKTAVDFSK